MQPKNKIPPTRKILNGIMLLAIFASVFIRDNLPSARVYAMTNAVAAQIGGHVLSDGQFVYGPNIRDFDVKTYLQDHSPYLTKYADDLYERSNYYSINPKVYLTVLEVHGKLISNPDAAKIENPFDLPDVGFIAQIEHLSQIMSDAYYLHLYSSQSQPLSLLAQNGNVIGISPDTNAGTYAIIAALSTIESQENILQILDNGQINGFYQTYIKLFGNDDPLDETNHISKPGESNFLSGLDHSLPLYSASGATALTAPSDLLQLPFLRGQSWFFGGVHSNGSGGQQTPYTDASALDFGPGGISWGGDTSNMWVVASAAGIPTKISNCYFSILHSGGWETTYYHIENIQNFSGSINQNDKIGVIANTLAEAICSGGSSTGPHVHFNLKHNGALVAINGTPLSGWYVHAGRWNYDTDPNYMWLERNGVKKFANINRVLSEAPPLPPQPTITGNIGVSGATLSYVDGTPKAVTSQLDGSYSLPVSGGWSGTVTPSHPCYTFNPAFHTYDTVTANQIGQDFAAIFNSASGCANVDVEIGGISPGQYGIPPGGQVSPNFPGTFKGPVEVRSMNGQYIFASERAIFGNSFTETLGMPNDQLTTEYWFSWYDGMTMKTWISIGAPTTNSADAQVDLYIGDTKMNADPYVISPGGQVSPTFPGTFQGPVRVVSTNGQNIIASERAIYGSSFTETVGVPDDQLTTEYWFSWYDGLTMKTWVSIGAPTTNSGDATVDLYIGDTKMNTDPYVISPGGQVSPPFPGTFKGPVRVVSTNGQNIIASERAIFGASFAETLGTANNRLTADYWFSWYDGLTMSTWISVGAP